MRAFNRCGDILHSLRKCLKHKNLLRVIVPLLLIAVFLAYYFPIYGIIIFPDEQLLAFGDTFYGIVDPFSLAPIIASLILAFIFVFYKEMIYRIVFAVLYVVSLLFSFIAIMGYTNLYDLRFYAVQIVVIAFIVVICILERKAHVD